MHWSFVFCFEEISTTALKGKNLFVEDKNNYFLERNSKIFTFRCDGLQASFVMEGIITTITTTGAEFPPLRS